MDQSPSRSSATTVADVARKAGVSKATAARVLGGYGTVSDRVRDAVTVAARALNSQPNELARSMTTGRSGTIGVVVGDIENPFFSLAMRGITDVAREAGFTAQHLQEKAAADAADGADDGADDRAHGRLFQGGAGHVAANGPGDELRDDGHQCFHDFPSERSARDGEWPGRTLASLSGRDLESAHPSPKDSASVTCG